MYLFNINTDIFTVQNAFLLHQAMHFSYSSNSTDYIQKFISLLQDSNLLNEDEEFRLLETNFSQGVVYPDN